ncbi:sensor domain-containing diguanylate cyclase [Litchfieldella xinjiangensis]|uniref:sensor domain-containing diguanylate cyclase n=1 Tax=Litchfieldella xinjiangensis TaxID=1166948 RepID=UPI0006932AD8|nr:diguanylate cyclase [Halomonas xinjiangensis]
MRSLQRNLLILFSLAVLIIVLMGTFVVLNAAEERRNNLLARESSERLLILEDVRAILFETESSHRAFALSGDSLFLEEHAIQRRDLASHLDRLAAMLMADEADLALFEQLKSLVAQRLVIMDDLIATRQEQGTSAAADKISSYQGKRIMDRAQETGARLATLERNRLNRRVEASERHSSQLIWLVILGALLNVLLLLGAFLLIHRESRRSERLVLQLRQSTEEVTLINKLSSGLQSCESRDDTTAVLQHYMESLFPGMTGGLYLMRDSRNLLQLATSWGDEADHLVDPIEPQSCWALRLGHTHAVSSPSRELTCKHWPDSEHGYICLPLMAQGEIVGMLHLQTRAPAQLGEIRRRAELLATHAAAAMAGILLREALHQQSVRDPLTNLYNRRYLEETMEREQIRARRNKTGFALIMLDVDHFKRFNDNYGHQAGDLLLKELAIFLKQYVRGDDIVCRYGGEEFMLVMPGATLEQCRERAEALRQNMVSLELEYQGQRLPSITASLGVAAYPEHGPEWETVQRLADEALYQAKRNGRNQVVVATPPQA